MMTASRAYHLISANKEKAMYKKVLRGTELSLSPIVLGTDVYGLDLSEEESFAMLDFYLSSGGNVIDTALVYSDWAPGERSRSEKLIGRWLKKSGMRNEVIISTKGAHPEIGHMDVPRLSRREIESDIDKSLMHLGIDCIDIYWLHRDSEKADIAEVAETLSSLVKAGKTRYFGLSNWTGERIDALNEYADKHGLYKAVSSQIQYSIAKSLPENNDPTLVLMNDSEYKFYSDTKMPVFAYASQAKGFFQKLDKGGEESLSTKARERYLSEENRKRYLRIKKVADSHGVGVGQAALAALICNKDFETFSIIGCKNLNQLDDTLKSADVILSMEEIEYIKDNSGIC